MKIEKEFYGEVDLDEEDSLELQTPIKVKYYKIKNIGLEEEGSSYGIEIIKEQNDLLESKREKEEIRSIYKNEDKTNEILEILKRNKVTPIELKDVIQDLTYKLE